MKTLNKLNNLKFILKSYWQVSKAYLFLFFFKQAFSAALAAITSIYLLKVVFEFMEGVRESGQTMMIVFIIICANVVNIIGSQYIDRCYSAKIETKVRGFLQKKLFQKALSIDYSFYDNAQFYDEFNMMIGESGTRPQLIMQRIGAIVYNFVNLLTVLSIVFQIDILVVVVIIIAVIISYIADVLAAKKSVQREMELAKDNKKIAYYKRVFYLKEYIEEIKTKKSMAFLLEDYDETITSKNKTNKSFGKWLGFCKIYNGIAQSFLISFGIYFILIYDLFKIKTITIGGLSALLGSIWNLTDQLQQLINHFAALGGNALFVDKMIAFLNRKTTQDEGVLDIEKRPLRLRLADVSFSYDGKNDVLHHINLDIAPGQKVAIVGENGAGKTTLVNLIMGLYSHYHGSIMLDGTDVRAYVKEQRRDYFQCLSQDYRIYAYSILENVCMGKEYSQEKVTDAVKQAGFTTKLEKLENGIETMLTKEYDETGENLSGGEKHMVAMARILVSDSFIICLDEPSSDLDPIGEKNFNRLLLSAFNNRTVIFISHRFYATQNVDKIYMLSNGTIIEEGSHDELIRRNGRYADMYRIQEEKFLYE